MVRAEHVHITSCREKGEKTKNKNKNKNKINKKTKKQKTKKCKVVLIFKSENFVLFVEFISEDQTTYDAVLEHIAVLKWGQ